MPAEYFKSTAVAKAAGMKPTRLHNLLDRNIVRCGPDDRDTPGTGHARLFTRRSACKIALLHALTRVGMPPAVAAKIADEYFHDSGTILINSEGQVTYLPDRNVDVDDVSVLVDLASFTARINERLGKAA
jgi:hypothetical protein